MKNLNSINPGETARINNIVCNSDIRRRLFDIGLTPGTLTECVGKSPAGDPKAFLIRGAVIALRSEVCQNILIQ